MQNTVNSEKVAEALQNVIPVVTALQRNKEQVLGTIQGLYDYLGKLALVRKWLEQA